MIIDIHTHIFPDKIAAAVLENADQNLGFPSLAPGTKGALTNQMNARRLLFEKS